MPNAIFEVKAKAGTRWRADGSEGAFNAGVSDAGNGVVFHECLSGELNVSGWWSFWAFAEFADGRTACGEAVRVFVWEEGT
jgi:hypothetical protein